MGYLCEKKMHAIVYRINHSGSLTVRPPPPPPFKIRTHEVRTALRKQHVPSNSPSIGFLCFFVKATSNYLDCDYIPDDQSIRSSKSTQSVVLHFIKCALLIHSEWGLRCFLLADFNLVRIRYTGRLGYTTPLSSPLFTEFFRTI